MATLQGIEKLQCIYNNSAQPNIRSNEVNLLIWAGGNNAISVAYIT